MNAMAWAVHVNDHSNPNNTTLPPVVPLHIVKVMVKENFYLLTPRTRIVVFLTDPRIVNKVHICTLNQTRKWAIVKLQVHPEEVVFGVEISGGVLGSHCPSEIGIVVSGTYEYSQDIQVMARRYTAWKNAFSQEKILKTRMFKLEAERKMREKELANVYKLLELVVESVEGRDDITKLYRVQLAEKTRASELMEKKDENEKKETEDIAEMETKKNMCTLEVIEKKDGDGSGEKDEDESGEKDEGEFGEKYGDGSEEKDESEFGEKYGDGSEEKDEGESGDKDGDGSGEKDEGEFGEKDGNESGEKDEGECGNKDGDGSGEKDEGESGDKDGDGIEEKYEGEFGEKDGDGIGEKDECKCGEKDEDESEENDEGEYGEKDGDGSEEKDEGECGEKDGDGSGDKDEGEFEEKDGNGSGEKDEGKCGKKDGDGSGKKDEDESEEKDECECGYEKTEETIISDLGLELMLAEQILDNLKVSLEKVNEEIKVLVQKKGDTKK